MLLSALSEFLPVIIPIFLIALRSFMSIDSSMAAKWKIISICGDPVIALTIGVILAFLTRRKWKRNEVNKLFQNSAEKAGGILVIIGAGGSFGAVLASAKIGTLISSGYAIGGLGILFPFLVTFFLKTAQGSSTVAIITAASIIQPLLPILGLNDDKGKLLAVLSMGAGSMMISHANDAYFWVISKFSGIETRSMFRVYSIATIFMGITSMAMVYILSL